MALKTFLSVVFTYCIKGHFDHLIKYIKPLRAVKFSTVPMAILLPFHRCFHPVKNVKHHKAIEVITDVSL